MKLYENPITDYVKLGNSKLPDDTAIFNIASATDCVNRGTARCQVDSEECYAYRTESWRTNVLRYRRRQGDFWDAHTAYEFSTLFSLWLERKRKTVSRLRFDVSGDIRNRQDIEKIDAIAESLDIPVYTYTASSHVNFDGINHVRIQMSNEELWGEYKGKSNVGRFKVVEDAEKAHEDWYRCPSDCKICNKCAKAKKIIQEIH